MMRKLLAVTLVLFLIMGLSSVISGDHDGGLEEEDDDLSEFLGILAIFFLSLGAIYVVFKRVYNWSRSWDEDKKEYKERVFQWYRKGRKPLLMLHNWSLILATIIASIHGFLLLDREFNDVLTGTIATILMVILSTFGIIIYYKLRPIWDNREAKGFVRFIHRQWILSLIFITVLILHIS